MSWHFANLSCAKLSSESAVRFYVFHAENYLFTKRTAWPKMLEEIKVEAPPGVTNPSPCHSLLHTVYKPATPKETRLFKSSYDRFKEEVHSKATWWRRIREGNTPPLLLLEKATPGGGSEYALVIPYYPGRITGSKFGGRIAILQGMPFRLAPRDLRTTKPADPDATGIANFLVSEMRKRLAPSLIPIPYLAHVYDPDLYRAVGRPRYQPD